MDSKASNSKELMDVNNLKYEEPAELALVESGGVFKQNPADQNQYSSNTGTEMIINLQSSTDFVYGPNCYLRFDVKCDGATITAGTGGVGLGFLNSPASALFSRFLLEDKSGAEVERIEDINKAVRSILPWKYPFDYRRSVEMAGQPFSTSVENDITSQSRYALNDNTALANVGNGIYLRVCIPLWYFSGLFKEETLIPPQLISGMRFRLSLARAVEAISPICKTTASGTALPTLDGKNLTYTIRNPVVVLDSYSLALSVQRNIEEQAQSAMGLPYTYETLYYQSGNADVQTAYNQQINKAVARAQKIWTQTQGTDNQVSVSSDSLGSKGFSYFQVQTRVGDWYAPQQVLQCGDGDGKKADCSRNCSELYANNLQNSQSNVCGMCMPSGLCDPYHDVSVSLSRFAEGVNSTTNSHNAVLCQNLNQSPHIGASGISVNNSRTAEIRLRYASDDGDKKQVQSWLQYVKVASVYPTRSVIKQ